MEKQFTQKDLAQKVNEKPSVIQDYESSKAIPNPQILGKLERILGVKLRGTYSCACFPRVRWFLMSLCASCAGSDIGKKLEGLKKA
jgi:transcriptional regulator with XRE-family HTH domain